jgi:predicted transcriptional regulator
MSTDTRRTDTQITLEILSAIKSGEKKITRIMYTCNLSYTGLKERINDFLTKGLVREAQEEKSNVYEITGKGIEMKKHLEELVKLLNL